MQMMEEGFSEKFKFEITVKKHKSGRFSFTINHQYGGAESNKVFFDEKEAWEAAREFLSHITCDLFTRGVIDYCYH